MKYHSPDQPITPDEQHANLSAIEANLAVEGLYLNVDDKALVMRSIDEGWSQEETLRRLMESWRQKGHLTEAQDVPAAVAE